MILGRADDKGYYQPRSQTIGLRKNPALAQTSGDPVVLLCQACCERPDKILFFTGSAFSPLFQIARRSSSERK